MGQYHQLSLPLLSLHSLSKEKKRRVCKLWIACKWLLGLWDSCYLLASHGKCTTSDAGMRASLWQQAWELAPKAVSNPSVKRCKEGNDDMRREVTQEQLETSKTGVAFRGSKVIQPLQKGCKPALMVTLYFQQCVKSLSVWHSTQTRVQHTQSMLCIQLRHQECNSSKKSGCISFSDQGELTANPILLVFFWLWLLLVLSKSYQGASPKHVPIYNPFSDKHL